MKLYQSSHSSCSWRVRIALAHKRIDCERVSVDVGPGGDPTYREVSPMRQIPTLEWEDDGTPRRVDQSMAIVEYLEERFPEPALLPGDRFARAQARRLAELVNAGIQPLQNASVLREVASVGGDAPAWAARFIDKGLRAFEAVVSDTSGQFCIGDEVTLADVYLVPQMFNARRFGVDLTDMATLLRIERACLELPAFRDSHPDRV